MTSPHLVIDIRALHSAAAQAVAVLKLLANEDRLLLLCQLSQGEMCVSELEKQLGGEGQHDAESQQLGIRQPTLSQQLGVLRTEGVVSTRRQGKNIYYSMADPAMLDIVAVLYRLYCPKETS